jgi:hypothetical protein
MDSSSPYIYIPLEHPDSTIRVIRILSITPETRCKISVVSLSDEPVFSALSYMWGDASLQETIFVDGKSVSVTTNLAHALRDVFGQWPSGCHKAPGVAQWLWTDVICINQQDVEEKNHQVPLMESIYSLAERTFAWLSVENKQTCQGLSAIETVWHQITKLSHFDLISTATRYFGAPPHIEAVENLTLEELQFDWEQLYACPPERSDFTAVFGAIADLARLPYWERLWIVQELVLSFHIVFISGTKTTTWEKLYIVWMWQKTFVRKCQPSVRPDFVPYEEWSILTDLKLDALGFIASIKCGMRFGLLNLAPVPYRDYTTTVDNLVTGFVFASMTYHYKATNPKEYVYAMAGVTGVRMRVDYSAEKTVSQVYQDFVELWIAAYRRCPDALATKRAVSALWFLDVAGCGWLWRKTPDLPLWAPDFAGFAQEAKQGKVVPIFKGRIHDVPVIDPEKYDLPYLLDGQLHCRGVLIDKISEVGPPIVPRAPNQDGDETTDAWRLWVVDCIARLQSGTLDTIFESICALFCKPKSNPPTVIDCVLFLTDLAYVCEKWRHMSTATFGRYIGLGDEEVQLLMSVSSTTNMSIEAGRNVRLGKIAYTGSVERPDSIDLFATTLLNYTRADSQVAGKCMAYMDSGKAGMFPPLIQAGDFYTSFAVPARRLVAHSPSKLLI